MIEGTHSGASEAISAVRVRSTEAAILATFNFDDKVAGVAYLSLSPAQQETFKAHFWNELANLTKWSAQEHWFPPAPRDLEIVVSDQYKISRSLSFAAIGQSGRMEFPAWKVVAGEAAIMHELVHVYFPNGNRLLAEGLAVYLQAKIGGNPAFPTFESPLHEVVCERVRKMVPEFASGNRDGLAKIRIADLDRISTPSPLRLRLGLNLYHPDDFGYAHTYPIAGSFVQFLIETYGMGKFRTLFASTPLHPFERNPGSPQRWAEVYGVPFNELEAEWKSQLGRGSAR